MTFITPAMALPPNGNPGIVPPHLQKPQPTPPIGLYPMPEPPKENTNGQPVI